MQQVLQVILMHTRVEHLLEALFPNVLDEEGPLAA